MPYRSGIRTTGSDYIAGKKPNIGRVDLLRIRNSHLPRQFGICRRHSGFRDGGQ